MKSYFFNGEPTDDLKNHPTGYDREYDADDHAAFFAPFFTGSGVLAGADKGACRVSVERGTTLRVAAGVVLARGRMAVLDGSETVEAGEGGAVVCRMDKTAAVRGFSLLVVEEPVDSEDICDVELARVTLTAVLGGYEAQVTDTRQYTNFAGQPPSIQVGDTPPKGPAIWFNTGWRQTQAVREVVLRLGGESDEADVAVSAAGTEYAVLNASLAPGEEQGVYVININP